MKRTTFETFKHNTLIRALAYPYVQISNRLRVWKYCYSEDSAYIRSLQNIHQGESCFIIGNGPSLTAKDLDALHESGAICFAANRIYQIYTQTKWRPTYYLCVDIYVLRNNYKKIQCSGEYPKFISNEVRRLERKPEDNVHYLCNFSNFTVDLRKRIPKDLNSDVSKYSTKTGTVTVNAIELAMYMGFKTIYLLELIIIIGIKEDLMEPYMLIQQ